MYTAYNHLYVRNYNHLFHSCTGRLLSYQFLSQIITHCRTRKVFSSHCEPTAISSSRLHSLVELLPKNSLIELLLNHWLLHSHSGNCFLRTALVELLPKTNCLDISVSLINPQSYERRELYCVTVFTATLPRKRACCRVTSLRLRAGNLVYRPAPSNSVASSNKGLTCAVAWRHRCCAEKIPPPLTAAQRVFCRELFSGRLPSNAQLRNPCRATQRLVDMSQYDYTTSFDPIFCHQV
jgi:hypothetical protein